MGSGRGQDGATGCHKLLNALKRLRRLKVLSLRHNEFDVSCSGPVPPCPVLPLPALRVGCMDWRQRQ